MQLDGKTRIAILNC